MEKVQVYTYRIAVVGDVAGILQIFEEVASEVPTRILPQTQEVVQKLVASRQSWVGVDADDNIVGYALAQPYDAETLSLVYVGVSKAARDRHVCASLISKLQEIGKSIVTDVRSNNKSSMVERFERFGFIKGNVNEDRTKLRWEKLATAAVT